jgi:hypothetical protein
MEENKRLRSNDIIHYVFIYYLNSLPSNLIQNRFYSYFNKPIPEVLCFDLELIVILLRTLHAPYHMLPKTRMSDIALSTIASELPALLRAPSSRGDLIFDHLSFSTHRFSSSMHIAHTVSHPPCTSHTLVLSHLP